jgi:hypothetical protein
MRTLFALGKSEESFEPFAFRAAGLGVTAKRM